jgi:cytochrome P450
MEGQIAFDTMLRRLPDMELLTAEPTYRDHYVIRGLDELRVGFTAQAAPVHEPA